MRWEDGRRSENVEDRRGAGARMGGPAVKVGGLGMVVVVVIGLLMGVNPLTLLSLVGGGSGGVTQAPQTAPAPGKPAQSGARDEQAEFVSVVLAETEDTWSQIFAAAGKRYPPPTLVMFSEGVRSACGLASAAAGPFYCPGDQKVYIDLSFFRELDQRFGAPGDFARAYVVAHEIGHHVQNVLGIAGKVHDLQQRVSEGQANALSVRMELQADCLAGVWAHHTNKRRAILEEGDVEEGLRAAAAIGDDRIQRQAQGYVRPESWTHGSSEMRVRWFKRGLQTGSVEQCDTFKAAQL
jgi:predicted metalloprotease